MQLKYNRVGDFPTLFLYQLRATERKAQVKDHLIITNQIHIDNIAGME